ncbi:MAG: phage holin family protein [Candidatus Limnocylindrales bacterium]
MLDFLARTAINAIALIVAIMVVPKIKFEYADQWWKLLVVAAIFGVINAYIRPIVSALSLPLTLLFLGMVGFIVNTVMLLLLAFISTNLDLRFTIAGWPVGDFKLETLIYAFIAGIIIAAVSAALGTIRKLVPGV